MNKICSFCGASEIQKKNVQYIYQKEDKFLVINNVPSEECSNCGERYYHTEVLKQIEKEFDNLEAGKRKAKIEVTVPVEEYAELVS